MNCLEDGDEGSAADGLADDARPITVLLSMIRSVDERSPAPSRAPALEDVDPCPDCVAALVAPLPDEELPMAGLEGDMEATAAPDHREERSCGRSYRILCLANEKHKERRELYCCHRAARTRFVTSLCACLSPPSLSCSHTHARARVSFSTHGS